MSNRQSLATLREMSQDLANVNYDTILQQMRSIRRIPIPLARLHAHSPIDRVRKNIGENLFTDVHHQLSYIKDEEVLANLTEFGRANKPHQALFYGSVNSTRVGTPRVTALAETSALFQDRAGINLQGELYTVSRWENVQELSLAEVVFSPNAIDANPDIRRAFERQQQFAVQIGEPDIGFIANSSYLSATNSPVPKPPIMTIKSPPLTPNSFSSIQTFKVSPFPVCKPTIGGRMSFSHRQSSTVT